MDTPVLALNARRHPDLASPLSYLGNQPNGYVARRGGHFEATGMATVRDPDLPQYRSMIGLDIENSTARINPAKATLRKVMYEMLEHALHAGGIDERFRDPPLDRGDGVLTLVHPVVQASKALLLNPVIPTLNKLLIEHDSRHPEQHFRLRAVVHAGEVHYDSNGAFGEALDIAFRLLEAPDLKKVLRCETAASMVLVASDDIYRSVIRHRYRGIDDAAFRPLVQVQVGEESYRGWVRLL